MEHDAFHAPYLSDTMPEAAFHRQAVKTVAYLRVSTAQQDRRSQRLAILEYARKHGFRIDDFIEATASGQASEERRRLDALMSVPFCGVEKFTLEALTMTPWRTRAVRERFPLMN